MVSCTAEGCPFYANKGCESRCSDHARQKVVNLLFMMPLPPETLEIIWRASGHEKRRTLTDDEMVHRLGRQPEDVLVPSQLVTERLQQIQHHEVSFGYHLTDFPGTQKLRKEDAERLMVAVNLRHPVGFHAETEKAIVRRTFHRGSLSKDLFPRGLCYEGVPECHSKMTREQISALVFGEQLAGGGGGGGGGSGGAFHVHPC